SAPPLGGFGEPSPSLGELMCRPSHSRWLLGLGFYRPKLRMSAVKPAEEFDRVRSANSYVLDREYRRAFAANGCPDIRSVNSKLGAVFLAIVTFGSIQQTVLVATKGR